MPEPVPLAPDLGLGDAGQVAELAVREAQPLHLPQRVRLSSSPSPAPIAPSPARSSARPLAWPDACHSPSAASSSASWCRNHGSIPVRSATASTDAPSRRARLIWKTRSGVGVRSADEHGLERLVLQPIVRRRGAEHPSGPVRLQAAEAFLEGLLERASDRHRFADRFHLGRERRIGRGELLERESGDLHHHVVEHRLERGRRDPRDVVGQLVQPVADGHLGPDAGDREARRLRRQRRGARDPRVHLDDELLARRRVDRELDVAAARRHADLADDADGRVAHHLVLAVGERHRGRDRDRVAGVDAHRVEVLDRADDHDVVRAVAHHLELELLPADDAALDQHRARPARARVPRRIRVSNSSRL